MSPRVVSAAEWVAARIDLTPLSRQDADVELRHHDRYP